MNCDIDRSDSACLLHGLIRSEDLTDLVLEDCRFYWRSLTYLSSSESNGRVTCLEHELIVNKHHHSLMLFFTFCALAHALPPAVDAWFPVPSNAFPALASSASNLLVLVSSWFQIGYRISSSFHRVFALLNFRHILRILFAWICSISHRLSNWFARWVFSTLAAVHLFSCVALHCTQCWWLAFAYICKTMIVLIWFAVPCFLQMFCDKICLVGHKLVSTPQLRGYFFL